MTFHCTQQLISLVNLKLSSLDQQSTLWDQYDKDIRVNIMTLLANKFLICLLEKVLKWIARKFAPIFFLSEKIFIEVYIDNGSCR